jgi:inhibitor of cysteine peptidase
MPHLVLTEADAGTVRVAQHDDNVMLSLRETPSTGYRWSVEASHPDVASVQKDRRGAEGSGVGSSGTREFPIHATKSGTVVLTAKLKREWEGDDSTIKSLSFPLEFR